MLSQSQNVSRGPYSDQVYKAAHNVVERYDDIMNSLCTMEGANVENNLIRLQDFD